MTTTNNISQADRDAFNARIVKLAFPLLQAGMSADDAIVAAIEEDRRRMLASLLPLTTPGADRDAFAARLHEALRAPK